MKTKAKSWALTLGDFITVAYRAWGKRRAKGLLWPAVNAHLVVFRGRQRFVIPEE
jgi:hypothetical protein